MDGTFSSGVALTINADLFSPYATGVKILHQKRTARESVGVRLFRLMLKD
jgi:hypothetical protein